MRYLLMILLFMGKLLAYNDFETNPHIPADAREMMRPHLLPKDHPMRKKLDHLFHSTRAIWNEETLKAAGFKIKRSQDKYSFIKVLSHPSLKGYLIKLHLDNEKRVKKEKPSWWWLTQRCVGSKRIRECLEKHSIKHFVVPHKWLYPLPILPFPGNDALHERKLVILLVEDMDLASDSESRKAWKTKINKKHLKELNTIIKESGGKSYRWDNVPLTKKGTFAFVDTEYPHIKGNFKNTEKSLSDEMRAVWRDLQGKKPKVAK